MSVQFIGYEGQAYAPTTTMRTWFTNKSTQIGLDIDVVWAGGQPKQREDDPRVENGKIVIFDFSTSGGRNEYANWDYLYYKDTSVSEQYLAEHEGQYPNRYFQLRYGRQMMRHPNTAKHCMEVPQGYDPRVYGETDYKTLWYSLQIRNIAQNADYNSASQLLDMLVGFWIDFCLDQAYYDSYEENKLKEVENHFLEHAQSLTNERVTRYESAVQDLANQEANLSQQLTQTAVRIRDAQRDLEHARATKHIDDEIVKHSVQGLRHNVNVKSFDYDKVSNTLKIYTPELYMYSPDRDERVIVGAYEISFNLTSRSVLLLNLTNQKRGRNHPHVPAGGVPCWGHLEVAMRNLLRDIELPSMVDVIVGYLEVYNPNDSWGTWAGWWFTHADTEFKQEDGSWKKTVELTTESIDTTAEELIDQLATS